MISTFVAPLALNLARRASFISCRALGYSPEEATAAADDIALVVASGITTVAAIVTLDVVGGSVSAGYLMLEANEAEERAKRRRA